MGGRSWRRAVAAGSAITGLRTGALNWLATGHQLGWTVVAAGGTAVLGFAGPVVLERLKESGDKGDEGLDRLGTADDLYSLPAAAGPRGEAPGVLPEGVARYLRPEAEIVSFVLRPELGCLVRWANSDDQTAVQLVTGDGGAGKTRLARRLDEELAGLGWRRWWVPAGPSGRRWLPLGTVPRPLS